MHHHYLVIGLITVVSGGCGTMVEPAQQAPTGTSDESPGRVPLDCKERGLPCALSEVPLDVLQRGHDLGRELIDMINDGTDMDSALDWIAQQNDIIDAHGDDHALRFCLRGGRDVWVLGKGVVAPAIDREPTADDEHNRVAQHVVGDDPSSKRGLALAPFQHDFGVYDSGDAVAHILRNTRGYGDQVTYAENSSEESTVVGISNFMDWDTYDAIHISSHGSTICIDALCSAVILTGDTYSTGLELLQITEAGINTVQSADTGGFYFAVGADFFRRHYPQGLNDTIVFIDACETVGAGDSDLALALVGDSSVYVGWNAPVQSNWSKEASDAMFRHMSDRGSTAEDAWRALGSLQVNTYVSAEGKTVSAGLQLTKREGVGQRLRELVTWRDPDDHRKLEQREALAFDGIPDDGVPDFIPYEIDVEGVTDDTIDSMILHVVIDDIAIEPRPLADGTVVNDYTRRIEGTVALGADLSVGQDVELQAWVELPDGGHSEQSITQVVEEPDDEDEVLVEAWVGQATNVFVGGLTDQTRRATVTVRFEQTPSPSHAPYLKTFRAASGRVTYSMSGSVQPFFDDRCTYSFGPIEFDIGTSDGRLEIDTRTSPASYTGFGSTDGPEIRVAQECGDYAFTTAARSVWLFASEADTFFVAPDGATITGSSSNTRNSWEWTFHREFSGSPQ